MAKKNTRVMRINPELADELERIAKQNNIKIIEAGKELARMIRNSKGRKILREIKF